MGQIVLGMVGVGLAFLFFLIGVAAGFAAGLKEAERQQKWW